MASGTLIARVPDFSVRTLAWAAVLLNLQLVFVVGYYVVTGVTPTDLRYAFYGMLWLNVGAYVLLKTRPPAAPSFETRRRAVAIAAGYFGLLAVFGGLVSSGVGEHASGFRVATLPPGFGPALVYAGSSVVLAITPAFLVGYLALAYLVYVTVLEAARSVVAGVLGLFSCISCTWPILAAIASSILGGAGVLGVTALDASYDLSTAVFLVTVVLLSWRPGFR